LLKLIVIVAKPTKAPVPESTSNPNKINIETRIASVTESQAIVEKATVGGTAVLHCYFDERQLPI